MGEIDKKALKETEIRTRYITPAIVRAGWDPNKNQVREEYTIAPGRIMVRGKLHTRQAPKSADYVLFLKPGLPLAVVEAKDNNHSIGAGMQQAQGYADCLDVPFIFSSNGDGFVFHDRTVTAGEIERELTLDEFPSPEELHRRWLDWKDVAPDAAATKVIEQDYYFHGKELRYYQLQAVNRTVEAVARGQRRALLVMATGTGKTFTAFQIIWRLWKSHRAKRVLFLADRNILVDQTRVNDFKPFGTAMTKITNRTADPSFEIFLAIYQAITGTEDAQNIYRKFSPDFFDLIVVDECHRGSARENAQWREVLDYFSGAVQVGLTATPKETTDTSNITYFGEPVFTYSLKQGIDDGYLAPYKVVRIDLDKDLQGWRPEDGQTDKHGEVIEDRVYNQRDFDRNLVLEQRTRLVAKKVTQYLNESGDRFAKTIVFCQDVDHAERMRSALANENSDLVAKNRKYVMRITGDDAEGKAELDNFIDPESLYPVIATTSELMSTGVDAQTCKLIVLDQSIASMTKFKQIIGRGTRINEEHGKFYFTIMDFRKATELFADPDFDGDPVVVYTPGPGEPLVPPEEVDPADPRGSQDLPATDPPIDTPGRRIKYVVGDVPVTLMAERVQYMGPDGKLITESLTDYTRKRIKDSYPTLGAFLNRWSQANSKQAIVAELQEQGVFFEALAEEVGRDFSPFDLVCHVAFDQPVLTRRQRADNVLATGYWAKYSSKAQATLKALLDKYADEGFEPDHDASVLKIRPFIDIGTPMEIVVEFGGRAGFNSAVEELEHQLYSTAS
ncbi:type I restriction enzyme R subunit [Microbacterium terrae]|uniref:Type-1 restriction enzyme R protein n=1 Tax=Microbacterium terrae TaxID=69369 RepID=A0A0M2HKM3_9MICO|nr:DEAD/DEAH box helicase family protein [Microbacterium terrae]KJL44941.1 Type-1 restriction enzyme R protein [Microbacterium terrae]MBP1076723.1 type I restriction enzyme R subunit [Microbacterium terrae]GLJ97554.1 DEAD/DEAH box helicase [Microbacterium terrae]